MPFKTKKRKLKASGRHFVFSEGAVRIVDLEKEEFKNGTSDIKQPAVGGENLSYLRGDLLRIVLTSLFILAAQILLRLTLS